MAVRARRGAFRRESPAARTVTSRRRRSARTVMSSRLPIGVATTNSVPGIGAAAFIVPLADRVDPSSTVLNRPSETMIASEPLPHFVDDLLGYLHETHPTYATL